MARAQSGRRLQEGRFDGETINQACTRCRGETTRQTWNEKDRVWHCMRCGADLVPGGPQTSAESEHDDGRI